MFVVLFKIERSKFKKIQNRGTKIKIKPNYNSTKNKHRKINFLEIKKISNTTMVNNLSLRITGQNC